MNSRTNCELSQIGALLRLHLATGPDDVVHIFTARLIHIARLISSPLNDGDDSSISSCITLWFRWAQHRANVIDERTLYYRAKPIGSKQSSLLCVTRYAPLGYERVYLPLCNVADTPFHIQRIMLFLLFQNDVYSIRLCKNCTRVSIQLCILTQ